MKSDKKAIALQYDPRFPAPFISAKGRNNLAEKILSVAKDRGVPIYSDDTLAENLMLFDVDVFIPEELYGIVAEILSFVYAIEKRAL